LLVAGLPQSGGMRAIFQIAIILSISSLFVHAQYVSFGGIVGASLGPDYTTWRYPVQLPPSTFPSGEAFNSINSRPDRATLSRG